MRTEVEDAPDDGLHEFIETKIDAYKETRFCYGMYMIVAGTVAGAMAPLVLTMLDPIFGVGGAHLFVAAIGTGVGTSVAFYWVCVRPGLRTQRNHMNDEVLDELMCANVEERLKLDVRSAPMRYGGFIDPALAKMAELESTVTSR